MHWSTPEINLNLKQSVFTNLVDTNEHILEKKKLFIVRDSPLFRHGFGSLRSEEFHTSASRQE